MHLFYEKTCQIVYCFSFLIVNSCASSKHFDEVLLDIGDAERYGVCWNLTDPYDVGERCFASVGMQATIGVGSYLGYSDFDSIYPWSGIRRCIIHDLENGLSEIIYEDSPRFDLNDKQSNVFVRIPKFYYEKYIKNGKEYRIISAKGEKVHPLFIENGQVIDEVFISAYEGYVDQEGRLRSIPEVIPTSNINGQTFLASAQMNGINYTLYDNRAVDAIFSLIAIEFGRRNVSTILGYGLADFWQPVLSKESVVLESIKQASCIKIRRQDINKLNKLIPVGTNLTICRGSQENIVAQRKIISISNSVDFSIISFDGDPIDVDTECFIGSAACTTNFSEIGPDGAALIWHTGRSNYVPNSITQNPIRYRWMENLWGNLWHFLPDVTFDKLQMYVCDNMVDYKMHSTSLPYRKIEHQFIENADNGVKLDLPGTNYWISSLAFFDDEIGISFGQSFDKNLVSKYGFGAYYYLSHDNVCIVNGGGFDHLWRCNILTNRAWVKPDTRWYLYGARLMYKDIKKGR